MSDINTIAIVGLVIASPFLLFVLIGNIIQIKDMDRRIKFWKKIKDK